MKKCPELFSHGRIFEKSLLPADSADSADSDLSLVWCIYLHLPYKSTTHVGKYTSLMDPMGIPGDSSRGPFFGIGEFT